MPAVAPMVRFPGVSLFHSTIRTLSCADVLDLTDEALLEEEVVQQPESKRSALYNIVSFPDDPFPVKRSSGK